MVNNTSTHKDTWKERFRIFTEKYVRKGGGSIEKVCMRTQGERRGLIIDILVRTYYVNDP